MQTTKIRQFVIRCPLKLCFALQRGQSVSMLATVSVRDKARIFGGEINFLQETVYPFIYSNKSLLVRRHNAMVSIKMRQKQS